jgi:hypothetical protein
MVPFISASDHVVFLDAGIPAMQFNHWPDNFYHSSADVAERTDPTEMKRTGFVGASSFYYLAIAGEGEAADLAWEAAANGEKWMAEVARQSARLLDTEGPELHDRFKAAHNKVFGAFNRGKGGVASVTDLSDGPEVQNLVDFLTESLESARDLQYEKLEAIYEARAQALGIRPRTIEETEAEQEWSLRVPRKLYNFYTDEYRSASARVRGLLPAGLNLPRLAATEIPWFVNGERSVTEIWRLVRAEYGNVTTSSDPWKFAYVVTPETADVQLDDVVAYLGAMREAGVIEIR